MREALARERLSHLQPHVGLRVVGKIARRMEAPVLLDRLGLLGLEQIDGDVARARLAKPRQARPEALGGLFGKSEDQVARERRARSAPGFPGRPGAPRRRGVSRRLKAPGPRTTARRRRRA